MGEYELATIIVSVGTAAVAGVFAWRSNRIANRSRQVAEEANRKADVANAIARESNAIARESNQIAERADIRIEALERDKMEHERAAVVTIAPDEFALTMHGSIDDYFPFQVSNIGRSRANGVRVRWWMMIFPEPDQVMKRLLSESFSLGDIRQDDDAAAILYLFIPPTSPSVDVRFQLSWDDRSGERYHHSEFVYSFERPDASQKSPLRHYFVGAYLDNEVHPTYRGRIDRQRTLENLRKLTGWLSSPRQANAPDDWTRLRRGSASVSDHLTRRMVDRDPS